ncbi:MAG: BMP family ABC transporter substrate-binding protein [Clostridiales bacterium]|nr:BMP family ABC transporter substrate-binding protein [Clostridiales bacterium]
MKRILAALLAVMMIAAVCLTGCGSSGSGKLAAIKKEDLKVAFLYVGTIGDLGYSFAHNQGRLALEEMGITTTYVENVPETAECEATLRQLCDEGYNVIYATSFGHGEWVEKVAKDYPNVYFGHATGYIQSDNTENYMGRVYEARYLAGIVAAMNSESGKIGYVAAMQIPEVVRGINAFTLGVRSVNPDATVEVVWTNTWFDVTIEKSAALELINKGCDLIAQHCDSTAPQLAAQEKGVKAIGYNTPTADAAPKAYLTAPLFHWDVFYKSDIESIMAGKWEPKTYWEGLSKGMVSLDDLTDNCVAGTKEAVEAAQAKIIDGSLVIFGGELKDNTGAVRVEAGKTMTDDELQSFDWFVEGVVGKIG